MSDRPKAQRYLRLTDEVWYWGPNVWSMEPVVACKLGVREEHASRLAQGAARLQMQFPEWLADSLVRAPGIMTADALGKVLASWALAALNEVRGCLHDAGAVKTPEGVTVWVGFHHPKVTGLALELAVLALTVAADRQDFSAELMKNGLEKLRQFCVRQHPDYQAAILMSAARRKGVPVLPFVPGSKYWQYGWGVNSRVFMESLSNADGHVAGSLANNKAASKAVFACLGVPTPHHVLIDEAAELVEAASVIGFPCVLKPLDLSGGTGVTANIRSMAELQVAYEHARRVTPRPLLVEQHVAGEDHRLMIVRGKLVAAIQRQAGSVVGDGGSTARQLIMELNADRSDNLVKSRYRAPIPLDEVLESHLAIQQLTLDSVLPAGRKITLRSNANLSTGGITFDVTDQVHPQLVAMVEDLAATIGMETAGFDYLTTDIARPAERGQGAFIEMNLNPGIDVLIAAGWPAEELGSMVLGELPGRIPVIACVLPQLDMEAARLALPAISGSKQAWVCGNQIRVGEVSFSQVADSTPWAGVRSALRNRAVGSLQIVCTVDEIMAHGFPLDRVDRVLLVGTSFPEPWNAVLRRWAESVEVVER